MLKITKTTVSLSFLGVCCYSFYDKTRPLQFQYTHTKLKPVIELNSVFSKAIYPSFFFNSGHGQTFLLPIVAFIEKVLAKNPFKNYSFTRKTILSSDEEAIQLDFFAKKKEIRGDSPTDFSFLKETSQKVAVIVPGATGGSGVFYLRDLKRKLIDRNYLVVVVNHRGIVDDSLLKSKLYHVGFTQDIREALEFLSKTMEKASFSLIGFSQGGNMVTKYLGEEGNRAEKLRIKAAVQICGPLDLVKFENFIEKDSWFQFYSKVYCTNLKAVLLKNKDFVFKNMSEEEKERKLAEISSFKLASDFYKGFVLPQFQFEDSEEYSKTNSGRYFLKDIKIPFLSIFAGDDPIVPVDSVSPEDYTQNENILHCVAACGGHCGFFKGLTLKRWIHKPIVDFVDDFI